MRKYRTSFLSYLPHKKIRKRNYKNNMAWADPTHVLFVNIGNYL